MSRYYFVFDLVDEYSNVVKDNNGSKLTVTIGDGELNTVLAGTTSFTSKNGCFQFFYNFNLI